MIRAAAALALIAPAWPVLRNATTRALWRAAPHLAARLAALAAAAVGVAAAIALLAPAWLLAALACVTLTVAVAESWLAHEGASHGGSLPGPRRLLLRGVWSDQQFYADQAARYGKIFRVRPVIRPVACITDLPTARALLKSADASLDVPPLPFSDFVPGGFLRYRDHESHTHYKGIFRTAFSREVVLTRESMLRDGFREGLTSAALEGRDGVPPRARVNRILFPLWAGLFAGFDPDAPELPRLKSLYRTIDVRDLRWTPKRRVRAAVDEIGRMLQAQAAHLGAPLDGAAPRCFLDTLHRHEPEALSDPAVLGNLVYLFHVTWSDMAGLLTWISRLLAENPAIARAARDETSDDRDGLCARIVLETLRLQQSEYLYRQTTAPVSVGGATVPAGSTVRVCVHEAHRDPAVFDRPETFDPDRFLDRTYSTDEYSPFGAHRHACIGGEVALAVAGIFTEELTAGFDLETTRDGPPVLTSWAHWAPSHRWRLAVSPAAVREAAEAALSSRA